MSFLAPLALGYTAEQIIDFLISSYPDLGRKIKQAKNLGHDAKAILSLFNGVSPKNLKDLEKKAGVSKGYNINPLIGAQEATERSNANEQIKKLGKGALGLAAGYGVTKILPKALQAASGLIQGTEGIGPSPMSNAPVKPNAPTASPSQPTTEPIQGTPQVATTATQAPSISPQQSVSLIDQMGIGSQIQNLHAAGNTPEAIAAAVGVSMKPHQRKWLDEQIKSGSAKSLPDLVTDYLGQSVTPSQPVNEKISPEIAQNVQKQTIVEEKPKLKPQKGELVATSSGDVGEIKSERNGKALVDVNGKLHQANASELELPNEELIQAVENLLKLPEIEKSSIISSLIYRPSKKEMFVKYHNGHSYVYEDVDQEDIRPIAEAMGIPVTTGKNIYGAWEKGKQDSRGAALIHGIIRNLKYSKENEGKTWEKLETPYDRYKKLYKQPKRKK